MSEIECPCTIPPDNKTDQNDKPQANNSTDNAKANPNRTEASPMRVARS
jgi:hypothetical protein